MAQKALSLAPFDYYTHHVMASVLMQSGELEQALAEFDRALELNPNASDSLATSAEALVYSGKAQEGVARLQSAMRLNPHHPDWFYWNLAKGEYAAGQYEEALTTMKKMNARPNRARVIVAAAYVRLDRLDEAQAVVKTILENNPDYSLETLREYLAVRYEDPTVPERYIEDLRKAGLPEG
jgi:tetratricopeptide (TPR) repeat protein